MVIDLWSDLVRIVRDQLARCSIEHDGMDDQEVLRRYFVLRHRLLPAGPYTVHLSEVAERRLRSELKGDDRLGAEALLRRAQSPDPLWPHQSDRLLRGGHHAAKPKPHPQHDMMLNDWGIQHLHLGLRMRRDGFVTRSKLLLYATVRERSLYAIDFAPHGRWNDEEVVAIIDRNWPQLLEPFVLKGVSPSGEPRHDRTALRKAGVWIATELRDGRVLVALGGGFVNSGHSLSAMMALSRVLNGLRVMRDQLLCREAELLARVRGAGVRSDELHVRLELQGELELVEATTGIRITQPNGVRWPQAFGM